MKKLLEFLKTTILGGLFVMLPVLLVFLVLAEAFELIVAAATSITDLLFADACTHAEFRVLLAIFLLVFISFKLGLLIRAETERRVGRWIERSLLGRLPAYNAIKSLTRGMADTGERKSFDLPPIKSVQFHVMFFDRFY